MSANLQASGLFWVCFYWLFLPLEYHFFLFYMSSYILYVGPCGCCIAEAVDDVLSTKSAEFFSGSQLICWWITYQWKFHVRLLLRWVYFTLHLVQRHSPSRTECLGCSLRAFYFVWIRECQYCLSVKTMWNLCSRSLLGL